MPRRLRAIGVIGVVCSAIALGMRMERGHPGAAGVAINLACIVFCGARLIWAKD